MKRYDEGLYTRIHDDVDTLSKMCYWHATKPSEENLILGEDWYINYADRDGETEIIEWVAIGDVKNKFEQSIEMFNALKKILLLSKNKKIVAYMRHITSYPFYTFFLENGYFKEINNYPQADYDLIPNKTEPLKQIINKNGSLSKYFKSNSKEFQEIEESIYHEVTFHITDKFIKKYQRKK